MNKYLNLFFWITTYLVIAFLIGQSMQGSVDGWYQSLNKPNFNPPNWIFPIMWTILYILIAIAGWNLWQVRASSRLKILYGSYILMNWAWSPIFFGAEQIFIGLLWITAINLLAVSFVIMANKPARLSALLMIPPLCWTIFASLLNYNIWLLNS